MLEWLRRNGFWLRVEAGLTVLGLLAVGVAGPLRVPSEQDVLAALAPQVVAALERVSPAEHHNHGHEVTAGDRVLCAAEPFGFEPPDAQSVSEVRVAYAYYLCAAAPPGTPWDQSARISGPVAVRLSQPPVVRIAQAGAGYPERVKALIPARYQARVNGFADSAVPARLRQRYEEQVAAQA
ncbi:hypothetical protein HDA40_006488 [Hamadaea flava]|uniref:Uncharacterized protein n=1 Tax=Hamadaea flava TaxID=1742688 RepID=A0ABV8LT21_9ACTN|nr:hypothetical protein [Hamadaea flava]MCP2327981.1 hypothetical protein [Hamadaea flava]